MARLSWSRTFRGTPTTPSLKTCPHCQLTKPLDDFPIARHAKDGRFWLCRPCNAAHMKARRAADPAYREKRAAYLAKNREKINAQTAERYWRNPDAARATAVEAQRKRREDGVLLPYMRQWRAENRERVLEQDAARRAREANATPAWACRASLAAIYAHRIKVEAETGEPHHVDHIVPLRGKSVCGLHVPWNLRVIPARENLRKRNKFDG